MATRKATLTKLTNDTGTNSETWKEKRDFLLSKSSWAFSRSALSTVRCFQDFSPLCAFSPIWSFTGFEPARGKPSPSPWQTARRPPPGSPLTCRSTPTSPCSFLSPRQVRQTKACTSRSHLRGLPDGWITLKIRCERVTSPPPTPPLL